MHELRERMRSEEGIQFLLRSSALFPWSRSLLEPGEVVASATAMEFQHKHTRLCFFFLSFSFLFVCVCLYVCGCMNELLPPSPAFLHTEARFHLNPEFTPEST